MSLLDRLRGTEQPRYLWAALVIIALLAWPPANAAPKNKNCGSRLEIAARLEGLNQKQMGHTTTSPAGRLELWTTKPIQFLGSDIFIAAHWTGITVTSRDGMCIEVRGNDWITSDPWKATP